MRTNELEHNDDTGVHISKGTVEARFSAAFLWQKISRTYLPLTPVAMPTYYNTSSLSPTLSQPNSVNSRYAKPRQGLDRLHPYVCNKTVGQVSETLPILFRKSLEAGRLYNDLKIGHITLINTKCSRKPLGINISLMLVIAKVLDYLVRDVIIQHMLSNNLFTDEHHGFVPGCSRVTQVLLVMKE